MAKHNTIRTLAALAASINLNNSKWAEPQPDDVFVGVDQEGKREYVVAMHLLVPSPTSKVGFVLTGIAVRRPNEQSNYDEAVAVAVKRLQALRDAVVTQADGTMDISPIGRLPELYRGEVEVAPFVLADQHSNIMFSRMHVHALNNGVVVPSRPYDTFPVHAYMERAFGFWKARTNERVRADKVPGIRIHSGKPFDFMRLIARTERSLGNHPLSTSVERRDHWWDRMKAQALINLEEAKEILQAAEARDFGLLRDGIGDNLYTTGGLAHLSKINLYADIRAVCESNASKLDNSQEDAAATAAHYTAKGLKVAIEPSAIGGKWLTRVTEDCVDNTGKAYPKGKYLKSVKNFHEPQFNPHLAESFRIGQDPEEAPAAAGSEGVQVLAA